MLFKILTCTHTRHTVKYIEINLTNEIKDLYSDNYKSLEKEMKSGKTSHVLRFVYLMLLKDYTIKMIYSFSEILF